MQPRIDDHVHNRLRVLKAIRRAEPVSRTELAELTGLAPATITEVVGDLSRRKLLLSEKRSTGGKGRPRIALRLNPDAAYVVGVTTGFSNSTQVDIVNARGDKLFTKTFKYARGKSLVARAERIATWIEKVIAASPYPKSAIHSVGLAEPAMVDSVRGVLHWLVTYPPHPTPMAALIRKRLGLPVFVDNEFNVYARAEHWFGDGRQLDDFTVIGIGLSVSLAQYVDGRMWTGGHGINAEFSHTKVLMGEGRRCVCGAKDCLVTYCSMHGIVSKAAAARNVDMREVPAVIDAFHGLAKEARAGNRAVRKVFEQAGTVFGIAVANYINLSNPRRITILAMDAVMREMIEPWFATAVKENTLPVLRDLVPIDWKVLDSATYAKGTAALVLEQLYRVPDRPRGHT